MDKIKQIEKIKKIVNELPLTMLLGRTILQERKFMKEIAALYKRWYPGEFIEWKDFETDPVTNADNKTHSHIYQGEIYSIDALFHYWCDNVLAERINDHVTTHDLQSDDQAREERK